ncbi:hypothetical protein F4212_15240 [Candidatus Poribacteria bacterium]|nr:hypothetical protein [Candidatus Poribacteria bacterium]
MNKKLYWGLLALIILLGTAQEQHVPQQADAGNRPPRDTKAGHKWEWHEMPMTPNDVPSQMPASDEIVFEPFELKSDLPDKLPVEFPTDAELQKMNAIDIIHLIRLYKAEVRTLRKTDYEAGTRLREATIPKLGARLLEIDEEDNARREERNRKSRASAGFYPATDGAPSMTLTVIPAEDVKPEDLGLEDWSENSDSEKNEGDSR